MVTLLSKLWIKSDNYKDSKVREKYGVLCGAVGIFLNVLLFLGKFFAGLLSGAISITADAFNNLSDAGSSFISMIGFKLSGRKPDLDHPFGHGRIEYISGLFVAVMIILMAYELIKDSIGKILHPELPKFSSLVAVILVVSIGVKIYMYFYNRSIGRKIESATMIATAKDSLSDTFSTMVVLASAIEPDESARNLATMLTASMDTNDFFTEAHAKLRPVESPTAGVFLSGVCQGPKDIPETVAQAGAAAVKVVGLLAKDKLTTNPCTAESNPLFCNGCASCEKVCPYGAISYEDRQVNDHGIRETRHVAVVNGALCHGCGACTVACPSGAMDLKGFSNRQILAEVDAICR